MSTKEKLIVLVGGTVLVFVGIIVALQLSRSSTDVIPIFGKIDRPDITSQLRPRSKILTVDFKTREETPKSADVFKITEKEISRENAIAMASKFGFKEKPTGKLTLTWTQGRKTLNIDLDNRSLAFKNQLVKPLKGKFSVDKLVDAASTFIKKSGLSTADLKADKINNQLLEFKANAELSTTSNTTKPFLIEIGFNRKLNDYNLFYRSPSIPPVSVILNNKGQIFGLSYKFTAVNEKTIGTYPLVDINKVEVAKLMSFGEWVYPQIGEGIFDPSLIKTIIIEDFFLGYLDDQSGEFVQPIYILRGFGSVGTESFSVVIYYPALQEEWLK